MSDNSIEKKLFPRARETVARGWALQTEEEFERMQKEFEQESEDDQSDFSDDDNNTYGLEVDLSWAVALKDTEETQYRPINENCVRRDVRYPPQLYLISYGEADDSKCLAHLMQPIHKRGDQKSDSQTILKKVIPALPNMTWLCLDEVEAKLYLVFGRTHKGLPVYYFKEFQLNFGALDLDSSFRNAAISDESQAMIKIDLGGIKSHDSLIPFLSPKHSTLLFYSCKIDLYDPHPAKSCPRHTKRNYIGSLRFETAGRKTKCRAKYHDFFVSWSSPFDIVFTNNGKGMAIFPIPIEDYTQSEDEPLIRELMKEHNNYMIGMSSVRVYSLALGEQEELLVHPTSKSDAPYGQVDLLQSLRSGLAASDCPTITEFQDMGSKVECFCNPQYKVFWGKVYKYGLLEYKDSGVLAVKYLHKKLLNGEIPNNIPEEHTMFMEYLSDLFMGEKFSDVALECEGFITRLVGKMGPTLYLTRSHITDKSLKAIRQLELGNVFKDYRVCAHCSATETKKRRRSDGKRIASFKVCRECKKRGFHTMFREFPCYYCSDECHRAGWDGHKFIHFFTKHIPPNFG